MQITLQKSKAGNVGLLTVVSTAIIALGVVGYMNAETIRFARIQNLLGRALGSEANTMGIEKMSQLLTQRLLYPSSYVPLANCIPSSTNPCLYLAAAPSDIISTPDWSFDTGSQTFSLNTCQSALSDSTRSKIYRPRPSSLNDIPDPTRNNCVLNQTTRVKLNQLNSSLTNTGYAKYTRYEAIVTASTVVPDPTKDNPQNTRTATQSARLVVTPPPAPVYVGSSITDAVTGNPATQPIDNSVQTKLKFNYSFRGIFDQVELAGPGYRQDQTPNCDRLDKTCSGTFTVTFPAGGNSGRMDFFFTVRQTWTGGFFAFSPHIYLLVGGNNTGSPSLECHLISDIVSPNALRTGSQANIFWVIHNATGSVTRTWSWTNAGNTVAPPMPVSLVSPSGLQGQFAIGTSLGNAGMNLNAYRLSVSDSVGTAPCSVDVTVKAPQTCCRTFCDFGKSGSNVYAHVFIPCAYPKCFDHHDPLCSNPYNFQRYWGPTEALPNQFFNAEDGLTYQVWSTDPLTQSAGDDCVVYSYPSPLVIDIEGNGIAMSQSQEEGVDFDIKGEGKKARVSWPIAKTSLFLVYNKDGKKEIGGQELFGNFTVGPDGKVAANGFEALAKYDSNKDGIIDEKDPIFSKLRLWSDKNRNGRIEPEELYTLKEKGITSINLKFKHTGKKDKAGNLFDLQSTVALTNGTERSIVDVIVVNYAEKAVANQLDEAMRSNLWLKNPRGAAASR